MLLIPIIRWPIMIKTNFETFISISMVYQLTYRRHLQPRPSVHMFAKYHLDLVGLSCLDVSDAVTVAHNLYGSNSL